jgi:hypothetical protein
MRKFNVAIKILGILCLAVTVSSTCYACGGSKTSQIPAQSVSLSIPAITSNTYISSQPTPGNTTTNSATSPVTSGASISLIPSVSTVKAGETFDLSVEVTTDTPSRGMQFAITWDPTKVQCTSTETGTYFQSFATAHNGDIYIVPSATAVADNSNGRFPKDNTGILMITISGAKAPDNSLYGVVGSGVVFVLHMTAKAGASGSVAFKLSDTLLMDNTFDFNDIHAATNNGSVAITA